MIRQSLHRVILVYELSIARRLLADLSEPSPSHLRARASIARRLLADPSELSPDSSSRLELSIAQSLLADPSEPLPEPSSRLEASIARRLLADSSEPSSESSSRSCCRSTASPRRSIRAVVVVILAQSFQSLGVSSSIRLATE
ncbi:hypothetical protein Dimus_001118 [Dionaea muscipula]